MKNNNSFLGAGIISAIAASLCCITPVLALITGTSGMAASFSWIEPFRPYLIVITVIVLAFAWHQKLKPKKIDCYCDENEKISFFQSKLFLGLVSVFAIVMTLFPYYSEVFYPSTEKKIIIVEKQNIQKITIDVEGMTCEACEQTINYSVNKLEGVIFSEASYANRNAIIEFDKTKTSTEDIKKAINKIGYKAVSTKNNHNEN